MHLFIKKRLLHHNRVLFIKFLTESPKCFGWALESSTISEIVLLVFHKAERMPSLTTDAGLFYLLNF